METIVTKLEVIDSREEHNPFLMDLTVRKQEVAY